MEGFAELVVEPAADLELYAFAVSDAQRADPAQASSSPSCISDYFRLVVGNQNGKLLSLPFFQGSNSQSNVITLAPFVGMSTLFLPVAMLHLCYYNQMKVIVKFSP